MKRQNLRNRHPFHDSRLATTLATTGRAAQLRRQLRLRIAIAILDLLAISTFIGAAITFCLEVKP